MVKTPIPAPDVSDLIQKLQERYPMKCRLLDPYHIINSDGEVLDVVTYKQCHPTKVATSVHITYKNPGKRYEYFMIFLRDYTKEGLIYQRVYLHKLMICAFYDLFNPSWVDNPILNKVPLLKRYNIITKMFGYRLTYKDGNKENCKLDNLLLEPTVRGMQERSYMTDKPKRTYTKKKISGEITTYADGFKSTLEEREKSRVYQREYQKCRKAHLQTFKKVLTARVPACVD